MQGVVIAGTHSGCGKTTVTLGILAALRKKGFNVQPFKVGPDFIDTGLHKLITGRTSRNLDLWMCGRDYVTDCFSRHSADADIAVVEGVMGMYDGNISTANLAVSLGLPLILVVDAYGMAESAGALIKGFRDWGLGISKKQIPAFTDPRPPIPNPFFAGVIFNRIASDRHYQRVKDSVQEVPVLGYLPRDIDFNIPHRHLGLTVAEEYPISAEAINRLADAVLEHIDMQRIIQDSKLYIQNSILRIPTPNPQPLTPGVKIAVAYDKAFCFYYEDNLDLLRQSGAEIVKFSPISDSAVPDDADALYIGGGYPELHAEKLSANKPMLESIRKYSAAGRPIYAECGGFMYLTEGIYDFENVFHPMAGVFPLKTIMKKGRSSLGYREAVLKERSILGKKGTVVRGHEFHYSEVLDSRGEVISPLHCTTSYSVKDGSGQSLADEGHRIKNTLGSYIHIHFGSNLSIPDSIIDFIKECHGKDHYCGTR